MTASKPPVDPSHSTDDNSALSPANAAYLDALYQQFEAHKSNGAQFQNGADQPDLDAGLRRFFTRLGNDAQVSAPSRTNGQLARHPEIAAEDAGKARKQAGVLRLIAQYRTRGHQLANLDPLGMYEVPTLSDLTLAANSLSEQDLDTEFNTGTFAVDEVMTLRDIMATLQRVYCGTLATEYMHITETVEKRWIQKRVEKRRSSYMEKPENKINILERLTAAEGLERYLHTKYVGQKRFSLEGSESLIPMLNDIIQRGGKVGAKEIVIGMAHRGRLNVLVNILGKAPLDLFGEFEGNYASLEGELETGDVKYHMGFSSDIVTPGGPVHIALAFNPSHLEIINPVVEGSVRARQERRRDRERDSVLPVLVHGDAAFAGQGVVMETLNMSQCRGYGTGGTIHIIVNNQIGFTTSNPVDARSTLYCTEIGKLVQAPIFHVNGDDPEAAVFAVKTALEYRNEFNKDIIIDLVSYRRHGHNEADEPSVTQPQMYKTIKALKTTREIYAQRLVDEGMLTQEQTIALVQGNRDSLDAGKVVAGQVIDPNKADKMIDWTPYFGVDWRSQIDTGVSIERLRATAARLHVLPDGFKVHNRVAKIIENRERMAAGDLPLDWGFAETMAYASLLEDGFSVRLSGQDSGRGTFFHRHAVLHNQLNRETYVPLRDTATDQASFLVINSLLSEEAVLGFEYGYSTTDPTTLVIWEAQFGDFANGAQVVIDQFITSGEAKWGRLSGLTLMLPHGYEGQGPEHSSARLERFLQLCANANVQVVVPSSPAQMFHLLRRQMLRPYRRPLIIMTPKSLLRHKLSTSRLEELAQGQFHPVISENDIATDTDVKRIVICAGKVYFELIEERESRGITDVAIIRIEQLYPFPRDELIEQLQRYGNATQVVWCQEEPQNQGAWYQIRHHLRACMSPQQQLLYAGREASASPAVGFYKLHVVQQAGLISAALVIDKA